MNTHGTYGSNGTSARKLECAKKKPAPMKGAGLLFRCGFPFIVCFPIAVENKSMLLSWGRMGARREVQGEKGTCGVDTKQAGRRKGSVKTELNRR